MSENLIRLDPIENNDELLAAIPGAVTAALDDAVMKLLAALSPRDMPGVRREPPMTLIAIVKLAVDRIEKIPDFIMLEASDPTPASPPLITGQANRELAQYVADELLPKALLKACKRSDRRTYDAAVNSWHPEIDIGEFIKRR